MKLTNAAKKIITYRVLSVTTEFIIVAVATNSLVTPTWVTAACITFHTLIHWLVEKRWRTK